MHNMNGLLLAIIGIWVVQAAMPSPAMTLVKESGCHNELFILNCIHFNQNQKGHSLRWKYKNPTTSKWETLATLSNGKLKPTWSGSQFQNRLTLHPNGSLEIESLKTHDETMYQCRVSALGARNTHVIDLTVECKGKLTHTKKQVCKGEDLLLDCDAKHRTNPKNLGKTTWRQKATMGTWHQVATSTGRVKANYKIHPNSSLVVQGQNNVDKLTFLCTATKTKAYLPPERHGIEIKYVMCETTTNAPTSTTNSPINGRSVAMQTASPKAVSPTQVATNGTATQKGCGGRLTAVSGSFQSPNFPKPYPANSYCKWTISVPRGYAAIDITLEYMDLEQEDNCQHDYIAIFDNLGNQVGCRRCGVYKKPIKFQVGGRVAMVVFSTDSDVQKSGFKLSYDAAMLVGKVGP